MGAKNWILVVSDHPKEALSRMQPLDRDASARLAAELFPSKKLTPLEDGNLGFASPDEGELLVGSFPGLTVVSFFELALDLPSQLPRRFLDLAAPGQNVYLHSMHSVVDWFAFAVWEGGRLRRSLSLSCDDGILENIGDRFEFELPYWEGEFPVVEEDEDEDEDDEEVDDYPFAFHPLELAEATLAALFGYVLEGEFQPEMIDPAEVPLLHFRLG